jgi:hypothetical protein
MTAATTHMLCFIRRGAPARAVHAVYGAMLFAGVLAGCDESFSVADYAGTEKLTNSPPAAVHPQYPFLGSQDADGTNLDRGFRQLVFAPERCHVFDSPDQVAFALRRPAPEVVSQNAVIIRGDVESSDANADLYKTNRGTLHPDTRANAIWTWWDTITIEGGPTYPCSSAPAASASQQVISVCEGVATAPAATGFPAGTPYPAADFDPNLLESGVPYFFLAWGVNGQGIVQQSTELRAFCVAPCDTSVVLAKQAFAAHCQPEI